MLARSKSELNKIAGSLRRGKATLVLKEPKPAKLPDGRRAGTVAGSPTPADYTFDERLQAMCADPQQRIRIRKFPLSLPRGRDPQQIFVTKAMAHANFGGDPKWEQYMDKIEKHLPLMRSDLFGGRRMYESCAVVGNSGNLRRAEWGAEIDGHEAVFRFNRAPTAGFEKWVGSRTDFRILNNMQARSYAHGGRRNMDAESLPPLAPSRVRTREERRRIDAWKRAPKDDCPLDHDSTLVLSRQAPNDTAYLLNAIRRQTDAQKMRDVRLTMLDGFMYHYAKGALGEFRRCLALRRGKDPHNWGRFRSPSSGVVITLGAIHLCKRVSVYGIGESAMKGSPYQYYKNQDHAIHLFGRANTHSHNFDLEKQWMLHLAREGLIRKCEYGACLEPGQSASSAGAAKAFGAERSRG